jgi:hypothetical protein
MSSTKVAKKIAAIICVVGLIFTLIGCTFHGSLRDENRANLMRLEIGMSKEQLLITMGDKTITAIDGKVSNPYKREIVQAKDGTNREVLYYYTEFYIPGASMDSTLTPIVLKDGKILGWGWSFLENSDLNKTITIKGR